MRFLLFLSPSTSTSDAWILYTVGLVLPDLFPPCRTSRQPHILLELYCHFLLDCTNMPSQLKHKLLPTKMHHSAQRHPLSLRIPSNLSLDTPDTPTSGQNTPRTPLLFARATPGSDAETMSPLIIVGISIAGAAVVVLALALLVRQHRKKAKKNTRAQPGLRSMERGIVNAKASGVGRRKSLDGSDDTHVVDAVYGEKVRSSFESSDYYALSHGGVKPVTRAAVTTSVVLPTPMSRAQPRLTAIDVRRANGTHHVPVVQEPSPLMAPLPPAAFPGTPSSVQQFYGPAVGRTDPRASLTQASAMRALAVAAGVTSTPTSPTFNIELKEKKGDLDLPIHLAPFRESTFGDGMKLGEHLGLKSERDRSQDISREQANESPASAPAPAPGSRPGTAGTFGQPAAGPFSFGSRAPYRTHKHAASSLSIADVRSVRISFASGQSSPRGSFAQSHARTESTSSNVITRKVMTVFPPLLPDELVLSVGEKVTLLQSFDDEWCVVGRDRFGDVEVGAVPVYVFSKVPAGEKMDRPMRSTSLGVKVEMSNSPGAHFSSREEVISWSNF